MYIRSILVKILRFCLPQRVYSFLKRYWYFVRHGHNELIFLRQQYEELTEKYTRIYDEFDRVRMHLTINDGKMNYLIYGRAVTMGTVEIQHPWSYEHKIDEKTDDKYKLLRGSSEVLTKRYANRLSHLIGAKYFNHFAPVSMLDVGCGDGLVTSLFLKQFPSVQNLQLIDIISYDVSHIKVANLKQSYGNVMDFLSIENERYDLIVANHVFEHIAPTDQFKFLNFIKERLTDEGYLYVETPNFYDDRVIKDFFWADPTHLRPYSISAISEIAKSLNLNIRLGVYNLQNEPIDFYVYVSNPHNLVMNHPDLFWLISKK